MPVKLRQIAPNVTGLTLNERAGVELVFSYETPLAVCLPGLGWIVNAECANVSRTSAKQRTQQGWKDRPHVDGNRFEVLMECALSLDWSQPSAHQTALDAWNETASPRMGG